MNANRAFFYVLSSCLFTSSKISLCSSETDTFCYMLGTNHNHSTLLAGHSPACSRLHGTTCRKKTQQIYFTQKHLQQTPNHLKRAPKHFLQTDFWPPHFVTFSLLAICCILIGRAFFANNSPTLRPSHLEPASVRHNSTTSFPTVPPTTLYDLPFPRYRQNKVFLGHISGTQARTDKPKAPLESPSPN